MSRLYTGIENLEKRIENAKKGDWGGLCYEKMSTPSKLMMKMFVKTLQAKKDKTETEQEMVKMLSASYDISDRKYIEPILECLKP